MSNLLKLPSLEEDKTYAETEAIHLRVVTNVAKGVAGITLIANGIEQINRPPTQGGSGFADVVASDPYFDIFWVPDRDQNRAVVNGVWVMWT